MATTLLDLAGASRAPSCWQDAALLLIDHQDEYLHGPLALTGMDAAVASAERLLAAARAHGAPVLHVAHRGAAGGLFDPASGGRFIEALAPVEGEARVEKNLPNSFAGTDLARRLVALRRPELIVAGFQTHMCVSATVRAALDHGYRVTLVASACATRDLPDPLGGPALAATDVHRAALAALHDRFATVILDESQLP